MISGCKIPSSSSEAAYYIADYLCDAESYDLIRHVYGVPESKWTNLKRRRLQNWGSLPGELGLNETDTELPQWLSCYSERFEYFFKNVGQLPNHVLVNEYLPGQGIMPHTDGSAYMPTVATISLGSSSVLYMYEREVSNSRSNVPSFAIFLEPNSVFLLMDDLYTKYLHGIEEVCEDVVDLVSKCVLFSTGDWIPLANFCLCPSLLNQSTRNIEENIVVFRRRTRVSLTFRIVP